MFSSWKYSHYFEFVSAKDEGEYRLWTVSADGARTHGNEFSSAHETVVVRICLVLLFSLLVLSVVFVSSCVLRMCDGELA